MNGEGYGVLTITKNQTLSHILRLSLCAAISISGFWCPYYFAGQFAEYDSRMGVVVFFALPFLILAAFFSIILIYNLIRKLKSVRAKWRYLVGCIGVILTVPSILAVLFIGIYYIFGLCFVAIQMFRDLLF